MTNPKKPQSSPPAGGESEPAVPGLPMAWVKVNHHSPDHIAARYPYAGYGSNLSLEQMARRCPTATALGAGILRDARLLFAYYLGIEQHAGSDVVLGVYRVTAADVAALDRCEGLGRSYDRFLVTVETNGRAVRCFTYIKRDNALEEPTDAYYQRCLSGFNDWQFDARRLRHARDRARKEGKRRTYSAASGYWDGRSTSIDWDRYRRGTTRSHPAALPAVPSYDGRYEPIANDMPALPPALDRSRPERKSLVTGRTLPARDANGQRVKATPLHRAPVDPTRTSVGGEDGQEEFFNPKNGERWRKGKHGVYYRVKE